MIKWLMLKCNLTVQGCKGWRWVRRRIFNFILGEKKKDNKISTVSPAYIMLSDRAYSTPWVKCRKGVLLTNKLKLFKSGKENMHHAGDNLTAERKESENPAEIIEDFKCSWRLSKKFWVQLQKLGLIYRTSYYNYTLL